MHEIWRALARIATNAPVDSGGARAASATGPEQAKLTPEQAKLTLRRRN